MDNKKIGRLVRNSDKWAVTYIGAGRIMTTMLVVDEQQDLIKEELAKDPVECVVKGNRVRLTAHLLGADVPPPNPLGDDLSLLSDDFGKEG